MSADKELHVLKELRSDSRQSFSDIAKRQGIPISTVFDKFQRLHRKGVIVRSCALLDHRRFAGTRAVLVIRSDDAARLGAYLMASPQINTLQRVHGGADFIADAWFPDQDTLSSWAGQLATNGARECTLHVVAEEVGAEQFLRSPAQPTP